MEQLKKKSHYRICYEGEDGFNVEIIYAVNKVEALLQFYHLCGKLIYSYMVNVSTLEYYFYNDEDSIRYRLFARVNCKARGGKYII